MSTRVWRQLAEDLPPLDTPAQESVLRLAMGLWVADVRAPLTPDQRQWVLERLCPRLSPAEKARIRAPLLAYMAHYHPRIAALVAQQFDDEEDRPCP